MPIFRRCSQAILCKPEKTRAQPAAVLVPGGQTCYSVFIEKHMCICCVHGEGIEVKNLERRFLLVDVSVLPEVFLKVLKAKELLAAGSAKNVSAATKMAGLSRSAFYKYKDCIFDAENSKEVLTVNATLLDETGALQSLLAGISAAGASIVTITQSRPENGAAQVEVTVRTGTMQMPVDEMLTRLSHQPCVVEIHRGA